MPSYAWLFPAVESKRDKITEILAGKSFSVAEEIR